jgi:hypothetical protein
MTYVLVGMIGAQRPNYDGQLGLLAQLNEVEAESIRLDDTTIPDGAMAYDDLRFAVMAGETIMRHNAEFNPPLNLVVGEVADGRLTALLLPNTPTPADGGHGTSGRRSESLIRTAALRLGVAVRRPT